MSHTRIAIVDDEPLAVRRLAIQLSKLENVECVGTALGCKDAIALVRRTNPDILLLDINMRDGSGFDVVHSFSDQWAPAVIFTTAFDQFAIQAFEISAIDYLLKPVELGRLAGSIVRARAAIASRDSNNQVSELHDLVETLRLELRQRNQDDRRSEIWVRNSNGAMVCVRAGDVHLVTIEEDYVRLHTASGSHLVRGSIRLIQDRFPEEEFVRVHRSSLVRRSFISSITRPLLGGAKVALTDGTSIPAGRVYLRALRASMSGRLTA